MNIRLIIGKNFQVLSWERYLERNYAIVEDDLSEVVDGTYVLPPEGRWGLYAPNEIVHLVLLGVNQDNPVPCLKTTSLQERAMIQIIRNGGLFKEKTRQLPSQLYTYMIRYAQLNYHLFTTSVQKQIYAFTEQEYMNMLFTPGSLCYEYIKDKHWFVAAPFFTNRTNS